MKKRIASLFMAIAMIASLGVNAMALDPVTITPSGVQKFDDVPTTHWAFAYVDKVTAAGMFNGLTPTWFGPADNMTRAQFVTVLARMEGQGALESVPTDTKFSDVDRNYRFAGPIAWATNTGIVEGYSDGTFRPTQAISRAQFAAMIHRYINYKKFDQTLANGKRISLNVVSPEPAQFPDFEQVSDVFKADVDYARTHGLVQGFGDGTLRPNIAINRAQIAAILARFIDVLTDSGYLPFLDGPDARNPVVIRNSTTTYTGGGGGGGGGRGRGGYDDTPGETTCSLTVVTKDNDGVVDAAYMENVSYGVTANEADVALSNVFFSDNTAHQTANVTENSSVILGVSIPNGKKIASITATSITATGGTANQALDISALAGYDTARSFTMTGDTTVTVTLENSEYFFVIAAQGGQTGTQLYIDQANTYESGPVGTTKELSEDAELVNAFRLLYSDGSDGRNYTKFVSSVENGLISEMILAKHSYDIDLADLGGASSAAIEPVVSKLIANASNVNLDDPAYAGKVAEVRQGMAKAAVARALKDGKIAPTSITTVANVPDPTNPSTATIRNNAYTYANANGVNISIKVATDQSTKDITDALEVKAVAKVERNTGTITVEPTVSPKGGDDAKIEITGTWTASMTGTVTIDGSILLTDESYRTQNVSDLLALARQDDPSFDTKLTGKIDEVEIDKAAIDKFKEDVNVADMIDLGAYLNKAQNQINDRMTKMENAITGAGAGVTSSEIRASMDRLSGLVAVSNFATADGNVITLKNFSGDGYNKQLDEIVTAVELLRIDIVKGASTKAGAENAIRAAINSVYGIAKSRLGSKAASADTMIDALAVAGSDEQAKLGVFYDELVKPAGTHDWDHYYSGAFEQEIPDNTYVNIVKDMGVGLNDDVPVTFELAIWKFVPGDTVNPSQLFTDATNIGAAGSHWAN